jgi:AraC family transcriptional regulator
VPSAFHLIHHATGAPAPEALVDTVVLASSRGHGWDGLIAECGHSHRYETENLAFEGYLIAVNFDDQPLRTEVKHPHGHAEVAGPPGSCWIFPAGMPFSHRNLAHAKWGAVEISADRVQRILGYPIDLRPAAGEIDEPLAAVTRALAREAFEGSPSGPLFTDGLAIALASRLARRAGLRMARPAAASLKRVLEKIEDTLAEPMTIDELAAVAGLSTAHFAREFKRHTNETPHAFVVRRRLERARQLLVAGGPIAEIATACGFSDQAHLSRLFKRRFGVTPGAFARLRP